MSITDPDPNNTFLRFVQNIKNFRTPLCIYRRIQIASLNRILVTYYLVRKYFVGVALSESLSSNTANKTNFCRF